MNKPEYLDKWNLINNSFHEWFDGQVWNKQKFYLSEKIWMEFKISKINIKKIFCLFEDILREDGYDLNWIDYQLPTLICITSKYIKQ